MTATSRGAERRVGLPARRRRGRATGRRQAGLREADPREGLHGPAPAGPRAIHDLLRGLPRPGRLWRRHRGPPRGRDAGRQRRRRGLGRPEELSHRRHAAAAGRQDLQHDRQRRPQHAGLCQADFGPRPLGHRGLREGLATEPGCRSPRISRKRKKTSTSRPTKNLRFQIPIKAIDHLPMQTTQPPSAPKARRSGWDRRRSG